VREHPAAVPTGSRTVLPGLRSMDHVAYTVPDLQQAVAFFVEHFGAELIFEDGPFRSDSDDMRERLDVDPDAGCRLAMLRLGSTTNLELFEYDAPRQRAEGPLNSDIGGHHLAFYVDDIEAARSYLQAVPGVRLMSGPNGVADDSPVAGQRWFYFTTPWGMHLEATTDGRRGFYYGLPGARMVPPGYQQ
jgi:catechol 2,3-dioxygenase-like lactoylglutathione lyase family enzyme